MDAHVDGTKKSSPLCSLPVELLWKITDTMGSVDHSSLSRTCRFLRHVLQSHLIFRFNTPEHNYLPLRRGLRYNDIGLVERSLAPGALPSLEITFRSELTPLGFAAYVGNTAAVSLLLRRGAEVKGAEHNGKPPLIHAVEGLDRYDFDRYYSRKAHISRHLNVINLLLKEGANPNYDISQEPYPTGLVEAGQPQFPMSRIVELYRTGDIGIKDAVRSLKTFVRVGANVNTKVRKCPRSWTYPLHAVLWEHDKSSMQLLWLLLHHGANPNLRDGDEELPLECLIVKSYNKRGVCDRQHRLRSLRILDWLVDSGVDVNQKGANGQTHLVHAISMAAQSWWEDDYWKHVDMVERLLRCGANPNVRSERYSDLSEPDDNTVGNDDENASTVDPAHSLLVNTLLLILYAGRPSEARSDYDTIVKLFELRAFWLEPGNIKTQVFLRMLPADCSWNNPIVPLLLKHGAGVSRADLEFVQAELDRLDN